MTAGAQAASVVAHVEPGCSLWTRPQGDVDPVGGIVVAVEEGRDDDSGEIVRVFRVTPLGYRVRFHRIKESDVNPESIEPFSTYNLEKVVLAMAGVLVHKPGNRHPKKRLDIPEDVELVRDMSRLVGLVMGGGRPPS